MSPSVHDQIVSMTNAANRLSGGSIPSIERSPPRTAWLNSGARRRRMMAWMGRQISRCIAAKTR